MATIEKKSKSAAGVRLLEPDASSVSAAAVGSGLIQDTTDALNRVPLAEREAFAEHLRHAMADWFRLHDTRTLLLEAAQELSAHPAMPDYLEAMEAIRREQTFSEDGE